MKWMTDWLRNILRGSKSKPFHPVSLDALSKIDQSDIPYPQELVEILGVVGEGQACFSGDGRRYEIHGFPVEAWRKTGGPIVSKQIFVQRLVRRNSKPHPLDEFPHYSIIRCQVLLNADQTRAMFWELLPPGAEDKELLKVAKQLQRPLVVRTAEIGEMTYDRKLKRFDGMLTWCGKDEVSAYVSAKDSEPDPDALDTLRALLADQNAWQIRITTFAAEKLLPTWIEHWKQAADPMLDIPAFIERISLSSIEFKEEGRFTFWYDDGDIFLGHMITVWGDLQEGPTDAVFQG